MSTRPSREEAVPLFAERYQLLDRIGEGGMGVVWRCFDLDLEEPVAIKFLRDEFINDVELRTSLRREVKLARRVTHPNVARVYEFGHHEDLYFLTMEFVPGETLQSLLAREGPQPRERVLAVARSLCAGLAAAHEAGVVHGDIKPGNILLAPGRGAVLTDFGIARSLSEVHMGHGPSVGTPIYMAHEQFLGAPKSLRSDVYAVGVVLFEMLTGKSPWPSNDLFTLLTHKHEARDPDLRLLAPELPDAWLELLADCMRTDPTRRPPDARALLERLQALEPPKTAAAPQTPPPRPAGSTSLHVRGPAHTQHELLRYGPLDPSTVRLYMQARTAYMASSQDALPFYEAALARAPDHPMLRLGHLLARAQAELAYQEPSVERLAVLRAEAEAALAEFPDLGEPHLLMASLCATANHPIACATHAREALVRNPNLPPAYLLLISMQLDVGRLDDAERDITVALAINQHNPFLWKCRARLFARTGRWDEFYALAEGVLADLHFRGPLLVGMMLWNPRRDVLERFAVNLAENIDGLPLPLCLEAQHVVHFMLDDDRRAHFEYLLAAHPGHRQSLMTRLHAQTLCEMACLLGDLPRAREQLAIALDNRLIDRQWLDHSPLLAPLRGERQFAEVRARVYRNADAVDAAFTD